MGGGLWIEPLIIVLERRDGDIDDFEVADGAVSTARSDVNSCHWFDVMAFAIEFNFAFAFEHEINLRRSLVIMRAGIGLDVDQMQAGSRAGQFGKGAPREATRTALRRQSIKLCDLVV